MEVCDALQSQRTVGSLWRESGLSWTDFLPEGEDVQTFISQQVGSQVILFCFHYIFIRNNFSITVNSPETPVGSFGRLWP